MSTDNTATNANDLQGKQMLKAKSKAKHFHQFFTVHFIAIFLSVVVGLSSILFVLTLQHNHSQTLITKRFVSLQTQFLQQTYLINANKLIDSILKNINSNELISLQKALSLQSKNISLLKSEHKNSYQQLFSSNNLAMNLISRIGSNHAENELLKSKSLIQLDTLLDAIEIQLNIQQADLKQAALLSKVETQLSNIVTTLKRLNLKMPVKTFERLSIQMKDIFVTDYARQLANQQYESQGMADIVRDFIRFEDLIFKEGLLAKWQDNLYLMDEYQQQLVEEQQQLQKILSELLVNQHDAESALVIGYYAEINKESKVFNLLPKWVVIFSAMLLSCVVGLLWLVRRKIKAVSQFNVDSISRVIEDEPSVVIDDEKNSVPQLHNQAFYTAESESLIRKIQRINSSKAEYLALIDKNQMLKEKIVKLKVSSKSTSQLLLEQQYCESLHLAAIKQLVLVGASAVTTTIGTSNKNDTAEAENYLNHAHLQGRYLVRQLRQASYYRYLQGNGVLLTLSDVSLVALIQAIVLNCRNELILCDNKLSVHIDENILTEVRLDAELFCEMFTAFVLLLFSEQKGRQLALKLQLIDKNNGQQNIYFTGQILGKEKTVQLPQALQAFSDDSLEHGDLGDYFKTLLQCQHGDDVSAKITAQACHFSFILPLAVANNQQEHRYSVLSLPGYLADIKNICVELTAKYLVMPIEVLLAVKAPEKYQYLQQLLQSMGLQITFVSCESMLQQHWQSGRFAVLMTEIDCQPFIEFMVDEGAKPSDRVALSRGVFSLTDVIDVTTNSQDFSHWILGKLIAKSTVSELLIAMKPWIKEQGCESFISEEETKKVISSNYGISDMAEENFALTPSKHAFSFNFERYLKHQGSAELAIFMLEEYTTENSVLVKELSQAFSVHDGKKADDIIRALLVNGKILAADHLLHLCQHWQALLTTQGLDNTEKLQITLLSKIKQAVDEISQHAVTVA